MLIIAQVSPARISRPQRPWYPMSIMSFRLKPQNKTANQRHFSRMSFLTELTPSTPRATSTALLISARELMKPLN